MFTPGFRLFFGFSMAAFVAALIYGFFSGDKSGTDALGYVDRDVFKGIVSLGWEGSVGDHLGYIVLVSLAVVAGFIAVTLVAFRDADAEAVAQLDGTTEVPAPQSPTAASWWPVAGALGAGVFMVGLGTSKAVWALGLAVMAVVAFEWMMSAWADRATGDPAVNKRLRRQIMGPIELPVLAIAGIGILALAMSRILLTVSLEGAVVVAGVLAVIVLAIGSLYAWRPTATGPVVGGLIAAFCVGVIALGIVSAAVGERDFHKLGEDAEHSEDGHGDDKDHSDDGDSHSEDGEALGAAGGGQ